MADQLHLAVSPDAVHLFLDFQLAYREVEKNYESLVASFDLSESRFIILMFLYYADDKQLLPSEIAHKLGVTKPTISKLLRGMEQQGLVSSHQSSTDKRVRDIQLTPAGEKLLRTFCPITIGPVPYYLKILLTKKNNNSRIYYENYSNPKTRSNNWRKTIMNTEKINLLETYLSLYINPMDVLKAGQTGQSPYVILDVRNAPAQIKKDQIKGAVAMPAKDLAAHLSELDKAKTYVVYDWNGGTILGKQAVLILLKAGFDAFELAGSLEGWKGMNLPLETIQ